MQNQLVVADKYRVPLLDGKLSVQHKILVRKGMKVLSKYVQDMNDQQNGQLFIIDEVATAALHQAKAEKAERRVVNKAQNSIKKAELIDVLINAKVGNAAPASAQGSVPAAFDPNTPDEELEYGQLKAKYPSLKGANKTQLLKAVAKFKAESAVPGERKTAPPTEE